MWMASSTAEAALAAKSLQTAGGIIQNTWEADFRDVPDNSGELILRAVLCRKGPHRGWFSLKCPLSLFSTE